MKIRLLLLFFVASVSGFSQDYFPVNTSVKTSASHYQAITNATLHPAPNQQIDNVAHYTVANLQMYLLATWHIVNLTDCHFTN